MQQDILGYLLGALDGPEQETMRERIAWDPDLRARLGEWERKLEPLSHLRWETTPPPDLAARTCAAVFDRAEAPATRVFAPALSEEHRAAGRSSRLRLLDAAIAACFLVGLGCLLSPAVLGMREQARLVNCQENLRHFAVALPAWANRLHGLLPHIPATGNAGVAGFYAPQLRDAGLISEDARVLCPSSSLAQQHANFRVPTVSQVYLAKGASLRDMQRTMGGSYFYALGYVNNGRLVARQILGRPRVAVLSDGVLVHGQEYRTPHSKNRMNILFEDGHVRCIVITPMRSADAATHAGTDWREMFVSDRGAVEAGRTESDVVLAPSWVRPVPADSAERWLNAADPRVFVPRDAFEAQRIDTLSVTRGF